MDGYGSKSLCKNKIKRILLLCLYKTNLRITLILSEENPGGKHHISAYQPDKITVAGRDYHSSIIISQSSIYPDWPPQTLAELNEEHWQPVLALKPAIVLLGTGEHFSLPKPSLLETFYQRGIGIECMHTRAACMTFSALAAEDRCVVAALLLK